MARYSFIYHRSAWTAARKAVLRRDGYRCRACGKAGVLEVDHIVPLRIDSSKPYNLENLQSLCRPCHFEKTARENGKLAPSAERVALQSLVEELK